MKMTGQTIVLAFDTSAAHCAAALLIGDRVVASRHVGMVKGQAEQLFPILESVLAEAGLGWNELDVIGVGTGPGNFTGIRIGVSAARGLALSLAIPAVGVSAFEALAFGTDGVVVASVSAPRGQIYVRRLPDTGAAPVQGEPESVALDVPAGVTPACIGAEAETLARRCAGRVATTAFSTCEAIARVALARRGDARLTRPAPVYVRSADAAPAADRPPVILP
jgi:tRNA threonylcarbamoyl adenosine modification protein YeaZ